MIPFSRTTIVTILALVLAACGHPPDLIGVEDPGAPVEQVAGVKKHQIFITTTRQLSDEPEAMFSDKRSQHVGLASVAVYVPPGHKAGKLERARRLPPDPRREFVVRDPRIYDVDREFIATIDAELLKRAPQDRNILVFIHGYNNTLSDSVLRVAQFVEDSGFKGVPVVFSWASAGKTARYVYDMNSVLAARPLLEDASAILIQAKAARGFDIFAHSMGSLLVMETMVQSDLRGNLGSSGRLMNIMLAAPDIDVDVFRSQLGQIRNNPGNIYVFTSSDDKALGLSRLLSGGVSRVGHARPEELEGLGVTVLDMSGITDATGKAHSKFAGSPEVVRLIGASLQNDHYNDESSGFRVFDLAAGAMVIEDLLE